MQTTYPHAVLLSVNDIVSNLPLILPSPFSSLFSYSISSSSALPTFLAGSLNGLLESGVMESKNYLFMIGCEIVHSQGLTEPNSLLK